MLIACRNCDYWGGKFLEPRGMCNKRLIYQRWNDACELYEDNPSLAHTRKKQDGYQPQREAEEATGIRQ